MFIHLFNQRTGMKRFASIMCKKHKFNQMAEATKQRRCARIVNRKSLIKRFEDMFEINWKDLVQELKKNAKERPGFRRTVAYVICLILQPVLAKTKFGDIDEWDEKDPVKITAFGRKMYNLYSLGINDMAEAKGTGHIYERLFSSILRRFVIPVVDDMKAFMNVSLTRHLLKS